MNRAEQNAILTELTQFLDRPLIRAVLADQTTVDTDHANGTIHLYDPWAMHADGTQPSQCGTVTGPHTRTLDATLTTCAACVTARVDADIAFAAAEDIRRATEDDQREWDGPDWDDNGRADHELDRAENRYANTQYQDKA